MPVTLSKDRWMSSSFSRFPAVAEYANRIRRHRQQSWKVNIGRADIKWSDEKGEGFIRWKMRWFKRMFNANPTPPPPQKKNQSLINQRCHRRGIATIFLLNRFLESFLFSINQSRLVLGYTRLFQNEMDQFFFFTNPELVRGWRSRPDTLKTRKNSVSPFELHDVEWKPIRHCWIHSKWKTKKTSIKMESYKQKTRRVTSRPSLVNGFGGGGITQNTD